MIVTDEGERVSPTTLAKRIVEHASYMAVETSFDIAAVMIDERRLTDKDRDRIEAAVEKQYDRVRALLGFPKLYG